MRAAVSKTSGPFGRLGAVEAEAGVALPPLPEPTAHEWRTPRPNGMWTGHLGYTRPTHCAGFQYDGPLFSAQQMREYADAALSVKTGVSEQWAERASAATRLHARLMRIHAACEDSRPKQAVGEMIAAALEMPEWVDLGSLLARAGPDTEQGGGRT